MTNGYVKWEERLGDIFSNGMNEQWFSTCYDSNKDSHISKQEIWVYTPCSICTVRGLKLPKLLLMLVFKMYFKSSTLTIILLNWNHELSIFAVAETKPTAILSVKTVTAKGKSS